MKGDHSDNGEARSMDERSNDDDNDIVLDEVRGSRKAAAAAPCVASGASHQQVDHGYEVGRANARR